MKMKIVTKRHGKEDPMNDVSILLRTINRLRNYALVPKGVYHFDTMEEADKWMIRQIASIHARRNSKT